ncbi:polysaccharide biosynthesis protein [Qipengyuania huizhouensis]|uniref:polysaccharide biosynthesis protein n=1 Tax=Qipengyuania huizhouensis TaxID=2867245 RepID=UPI001C888156|nr:nucleoside-diphosphate sugar epimerase/dehydratase [Qipengyuania huizhouensis]MBX7460391.1 polysaccharide biosynthesis protein [Qipengyuania huizhouensis]
MIEQLRLLSTLSRRQKVALQIVVDTGLILFCFLAAMAIRLESFEFLYNLKIWLPVSISAGVAIGAFWLAGLYRTLVRFVTGKILTSIAKGVLVFAITLFVTNSLLTSGIPRSVPIISGLLLLLAIGGLRFAVRQVFRKPMQVTKRPVVIYGAGEAGLELLNSLFHGRDYTPIAFVDDDCHLQGLTISGFPVYSPQAISKLTEEAALEVVLLAMPNLSHSRRREIFTSLESMSLEVKTIPGLSDIISGKAKISELRNVTAEDLLGRDAVAPNEKLLKRTITGKVVMVTGAGGSIGSELCRQILAQRPEELILYEISEYALYSIEQELREMAKTLGSPTKLIPVLGSVQNAKRLETAIKAFKIQTIYHAAAYKHVPLVEENVVEGIRNNVFGTLTIARLAHENSVTSFILISTDKAVRPTNVMGATKRIAELICQAFAQDGSATNFSMVRFGNVLGSSGSVIPRFRSQIEAGGPVTVTHPDINRYFMTIPEASQLVIQAGAMASGGDVFVLDMGDPVRIADLAVTMVKLHGLTPYFVDHPDEVAPEEGDIPICFTGLRKGEKLYEELLIGNNPQATEHPRVMSAKEIAMSPEQLLPFLNRLLEACKSFDLIAIRQILSELPLEYTPLEKQLTDLVWEASRKSEPAERQAEITRISQ